ncbi:dodecin family protein [Mesorhizobium sp. B1-1-8]|uniref:dodecin family protein n=1 Tax=Mesorhizobium sp. B1-1-8 TaxID=2589976 RepID=UPI00112642ED|nr:dodecin family protein [Mesorhizobium sp. B1-1-8]UCI05788.1 dodecin family protein [Mesorhizobium sp. B1-1-8]
MSVARVTEITSSSSKSFQDAIEQGIARAAKTLKNVEGAWIQDQKIDVQDGKISAYRVNMKVTFILMD